MIFGNAAFIPIFLDQQRRAREEREAREAADRQQEEAARIRAYRETKVYEGPVTVSLESRYTTVK